MLLPTSSEVGQEAVSTIDFVNNISHAVDLYGIIVLCIGIWKGLKAVYPETTFHGCTFHWAQVVYRKIQELGLCKTYNSGGSLRRMLRRILALPFLPAEHILPAFNKLRQKAPDMLTPLLEYINNTWMNSSAWKIEEWTCFMRTLRTNNDVEGWHHRLNSRAGRACLHFYRLIRLLHEEALLVPIQVSLVSDGKLKRYRSKASRSLNGKIFAVWESYNNKTITASQLLKSCSRIYSVV